MLYWSSWAIARSVFDVPNLSWDLISAPCSSISTNWNRMGGIACSMHPSWQVPSNFDLWSRTILRKMIAALLRTMVSLNQGRGTILVPPLSKLCTMRYGILLGSGKMHDLLLARSFIKYNLSPVWSVHHPVNYMQSNVKPRYFWLGSPALAHPINSGVAI